MTFKMKTSARMFKACKALDRAGIAYDTNFDQDVMRGGKLINCEVVVLDTIDQDWIDYLSK